MFTLDQILDLVGPLDDTPGDDTPRERFRRFLEKSVDSIGAVRDYIEASIRNKGPQYDRALQDLVNHVGTLIGFNVEYGRYQGVVNAIGHDGLWRRNDFSIVVEVKTTDAFSIQTATLVGYIDRLISAGKIPDWDHAMGLYIFARTDSQLTQLVNSIIAEKRTRQLRIAAVEDVLSLAELVQAELITPDEAVMLLRPAGVFVTDTIRLLSRIAAQATDTGTPGAKSELPGEPHVQSASIPATVPATSPEAAQHVAGTEQRLHVLTPIRDRPDQTARDTLRQLLGAGWYAFGEKTPFHDKLKPGDRICFYETGVGVVADAVVASSPKKNPPEAEEIVKKFDKFPWAFKVRDVRLFFDAPVVIDADLRSKLDAFAGRDPANPWAWFVQTTRAVTEHDFAILTGKDASE